MGIRQAIKALAPTRPERSELLTAMMRPRETMLIPFSYDGPSDEMVSRGSSHVFHACSILASAGASKGFRLYRAADTHEMSKRLGRDVRGSNHHHTKPVNKKNVRLHSGKAAVYGRMADEIVEVVDHPALDLLNDGNPFACGQGIVEEMLFFFALTGNSYLNVVHGSGGLPAELWNLASQYVRIVGDTDNYIEAYQYSRNRHHEVVFEPEKVLHAKKPNPFHPLYGASWLAGSLMEADIDQAQRQHTLSSYLNSSVPSILAVVKGATENAVKSLVEKLEGRHRGPQNANKIGAINAGSDGGVDLHQLGMTPESLQLIEHLAWNRDVLMSRAGIPKSLYSTDDVNLANAEIGLLHFERNTLIPMMSYVAAMLTEQYLPMFGVEGGELFFGVEETDATDVEAESNRLNTLVQGGILTPNEARQELGYDKVKGADELQKPASGDPFGGFTFGGASVGSNEQKRTATDTKAIPDLTQPEPAPEPEEVDESGTEGQETADKATKVAPKQNVQNVQSAPVVIEHKAWLFGDEECGCSEDTCIEEVDTFAVKAALPRTPEANFTDDLTEFFTKQTDAISARVKSSTDDFSIGSLVAPKSYASTKNTEPEWNALLAEILETHGTPAFIDGGSEALDQIAGSVAGSFNVRNERAEAFFDRYTTSLARTSAAINKQTETQVTRMIQQGLKEGLTSIDLSKAIQERLTEIGPARALRVARSETSRARGSAVEAGWAQSDLVKGKKWVTAPNECEFCQKAEGKTAKLGEPFYTKGTVITGTEGGTLKLNFEDIHHHPLHPNCRCSVTAIRKGDE